MHDVWQNGGKPWKQLHNVADLSKLLISPEQRGECRWLVLGGGCAGRVFLGRVPNRR